MSKKQEGGEIRSLRTGYTEHDLAVARFWGQTVVNGLPSTWPPHDVTVPVLVVLRCKDCGQKCGAVIGYEDQVWLDAERLVSKPTGRRWIPERIAPLIADAPEPLVTCAGCEHTVDLDLARLRAAVMQRLEQQDSGPTELLVSERRDTP